MKTPPVHLGVERILHDLPSFPSVLREARQIGFVTSDGARTGQHGEDSAGQLTTPPSTRQRLLEAGVPLTTLFSPEHGLSARAPDGSPVEDGRDPGTGLPVVSLYGARLDPEPELLKKHDLVLFDLQDVGVRFYTFVWTLTHVMEVCGAAGVPLWVLDRPNPLGGRPEWVEGPLPDPGVAPSFLGRWPIPIRHSLTLGEMAVLLRYEMELDLELEVVRMEGWRRDQLWPDTGLPFHPPSPGIPSFETSLLYPGLAFLEATNVHEGRGTDLSFQWFGAPWLDAELAAVALNERDLPGVRARASSLSGPGGSSDGVLLEVTDPGRVRPVSLGLHLLSLLGTLWPGDFRWSSYPTVVNPGGQDHLLRLLGSREAVGLLEGDPAALTGARIFDLTRAPGWWDRATPHLLYS